MRLADIVGGPWAITPEMFCEVQGIYSRHMRGEKIDLASVEARIGAPLNNARQDYEVQDGVAIIAADGVLAKRMNLFMQISGGTSTQVLNNQVKAALEDPMVKSIIIAVDSPGGTVDGTQEVANTIFNARGTKPVIALADGMMASAAYWIGSAADKIFIASDTTAVGSIGVVATHVDVSGQEQQAGVKTTEITAGKYKRIASQFGPLSEQGRADLQSKVDYLYSVFVEDVARNRGVAVQTVLNNMADGQVFIGKQSVEAGLVDGVSTLSDLVARAAAGEFVNAASTTKAEASAGDAPKVEAEKEDTQIMDMEKLKAEHPALAEALIAEGFDAGKIAGAKAERERIQAVEEQSLPGHEALIESFKFDGKTTGEQAAVAVLNAEREKLGGKLASIRKDGAAVAAVPAAKAPENDSAVPSADAPVEERAKHEWDKDAKLRAEFGGKFESYLAWYRASDRGAARVMAK